MFVTKINTSDWKVVYPFSTCTYDAKFICTRKSFLNSENTDTEIKINSNNKTVAIRK